MSYNRGERRARTERTVKRRLKKGEHVIFGLGKERRAQPHRMHKTKMKFTSQHSSMKGQKQKANRAARHDVKQRVKADKDIQPTSPNSVRWDYW